MAQRALLVIATLAALVAATGPAAANQIAVVVNGQAITTYDIDRRINMLRLQRQSGNLRKKAREQLVEEAIKMTEVLRLNATVSNAQVNQSFARFAASNRLTPGQMAKALAQAGVTADHFRQFIRVQMSWPRVVNARFGNSGRMSTEEVVARMLERGGEKPTTTEYILQQVIFVVPQAKRKALLPGRKRDADALRSRFTDCASTREFAKGLIDVTVRDLGRIMQPQLPPEWKPLITKTGSGRVTRARVTQRGVEFIAVCAAEQVSDDLAAELIFRSEQANQAVDQSANGKKYLQELRKRARVVYR